MVIVGAEVDVIAVFLTIGLAVFAVVLLFAKRSNGEEE